MQLIILFLRSLILLPLVMVHVALPVILSLLRTISIAGLIKAVMMKRLTLSSKTPTQLKNFRFDRYSTRLSVILSFL